MASCLVVGLAWLGTTSLTQSQTRSQNLEAIPLQFNAPPEPEVGDPSGRGRGGGNRDGCNAYANLTALVPHTQDGNREKVWGITTEAHPTFWFYLPQPMNAKMPMQFVLLDNAGNQIYSETFNPLPTPAGIIHIALPKTAPPLQVNQAYRWGMAISCEPGHQANTVTVRGMIYRQALSAADKLQLESAQHPLDRARIYAKSGIWFEALTTLAQQRSAEHKPQPEIVKAWSALLRQGNLSSVEQAPLVPCCRP